MTQTIKIKTRTGYLNPGKIETHYEWTTGPRNLLAAYACLIEHREDRAERYGNIGGGTSWLEIDGVQIADWVLSDLDPTEPRGTKPTVNGGRREMSRTDVAREIIAGVRSRPKAYMPTWTYEPSYA